MTHSEMSEDEKVLEVDRQVRAGGHVWCPWCRAMNMPNKPECCVAFRSCLEDRAEAQLQSVITQQLAIEIGQSDAIVCPYCTQVNFAPEGGRNRHPSEWKRPMQSPFCCDTLQSAIVAVIQRKRTEEYIRKAGQIGEAVDKAARN